jgi:O-antigen/teichoic acid export membrane protein
VIKKIFTESIVKIIFVGGGNGLNAIFGFIFLTAIARTLTLGDFGKYALITSLLVSLSRLMDFGTTATFVAKAIADKRETLNSALISARIILFFLTIPVFLLAALIFNVLTPTILLLFILGLVGYFLNYTFYAYFQKDQKFFNLVILNLLPAIVKVTFGILILLNLVHIDLISGFAIFSLSLLTSIFLFFAVPNEYKNITLGIKGIKNLLKYATPAGISQMVFEGWPALNNGIAKFIRGFSDVGIFSLANKISQVFSLISYSIFTVLLPKNAKLKKQNVKYDFKETIFISVGVLMVSLVGVVFAEYFVDILFGEKFAESIRLLDILIFANAFSAIHTFMENYFFIEKKTKLILYINLSKLTIFTISVVVLTGYMQLMGLAVANLIASIGALFITFLFIKRTQKHINLREL